MATRDERIRRQLSEARQAGNQADVKELTRLLGNGSKSTNQTTRKDRIQSQIEEARKAGNMEDVARLQGLTNQQPNMEPVLQDLARKRREATKQALQGRLEGELSALAGEREQVAPAFRQARTGVRTQDVLLREGAQQLLGGQGLGQSGARAQSEIAQNVATQGAIGGLQRQEAQTLSDIARREAGARQAFASDLAAAEAGIEADTLTQLVNQRNQERAFQLQQAGLTGQLGGQRTLAGQQFDIQNQLRNIELEQQAVDREIATIGQYGADYQAEIDRRTQVNPNDPLIPYLRIARQQKLAGMQDAEIQAQLQQQAQQEKAYTNAFKLWDQLGYVANEQMAQILGVPVGTQTSDQSYRDAQLNLSRAREGRLSAPRQTTQDAISPTSFRRGLEATLERLPTTTDLLGNTIPPSAQQVRETSADYIVNQIQSGLMNTDQARQLVVEFGLTPQDIDSAEERQQRNVQIIENFDPFNLRR